MTVTRTIVASESVNEILEFSLSFHKYQEPGKLRREFLTFTGGVPVTNQLVPPTLEMHSAMRSE